MINEIFFAFWFFSPAGVANILAFFSGKIPYLQKFSYPVDFNKKFRGKRILGSHKTIRGFIFGILGGIFIVYLQIFLYNIIPYLRQVLPLNYNTINPILFGTLCGFGALAGDGIKSFFKRQMNIKPGKSWFPYDQIDYILGGIFFTSFYLRLSLTLYAFIFVVWFLIHPLTTFIGYLLRLKKEPL